MSSACLWPCVVGQKDIQACEHCEWRARADCPAGEEHAVDSEAAEARVHHGDEEVMFRWGEAYPDPYPGIPYPPGCRVSHTHANH